MQDQDRTDVVVVGGGLAGLGAAAFLARAGARVLGLEQASAVGGRASTTVVDGFSLNRGPHALYRAGEAAAALAELGIDVRGQRAPARGVALHQGRLHRLPIGALSMLGTSLFGWGGKAEAGRLLATLPGVDTTKLAGVSVAEWLAANVDDAVVRDLVAAFFRVSTYANAPEFSAATAIRQLARAASSGVLYVDGGWQTLADGLAARARASGASFTAGVHVEALETRGPHDHVVVLASGRRIAARAVVLAVPPREAVRLLATAGVTAPSAMTEVTPVRMAALDVALSRLPVDSPRFVLGVDQPVYLSLHSDVAKLAPEGGALIHVGKYLPLRETDAREDRAELEAVLDLAQPGWREVLVHARYLPKITVAERLDRAEEGGDASRPGPELGEAPGMFLAGDWVKGGSWLADASLGSARLAAEQVLARLETAKAAA